MDRMAAAYSIRLEIDSAEEDLLSAALADHAPTGIVNHGLGSGRCRLEAWFPSESAARDCAAALAAHHPAVLESEDRDWNAEWQANWQPVECGRIWFLTPPDFSGETPPGRIRIDMHPGTLFGNGDHPTTLLCLEALEEAVTPGATFLDIGCGSGLLTHAASLLGARATGCDLDSRAARAAASFGAGAFVGSVDSVKSRSIDVAVANIQLGVLEALLPDIAAALSPRGIALLSGILQSQREDLIAAVESAGLAPFMESERDAWLLVAARTGRYPTEI